MRKTDKILLVDNLAEKIKRAKSVALVDYTNMKASQMSEVRDALRAVSGLELLVVKNTLFIKALQKAGLAWKKDLDKNLEGQSALLISSEDEVAGLSIISKLADQMGSLKFKLGVLGDRLMDNAEVSTLAALPTKDVLRAQVVGTLARPLSGFVYALSWNLGNLVRVLSAVKETKSATVA